LSTDEGTVQQANRTSYYWLEAKLSLPGIEFCFTVYASALTGYRPLCEKAEVANHSLSGATE
jgi:hypothetical protein